MTKVLKYLITICSVVALAACADKTEVDLIIYDAEIYTVDSVFSKQDAFAVKDGEFVAIGSMMQILKDFKSTKILDLNGLPVFPGFYDGHAHFYRYALGLRNVNLVGSESFQEVLSRLKNFEEVNPDAKWIVGRGWDQNLWKEKKFPDRQLLDEAFPDKAVYLTRIDGHAAVVNKKAMEIAKLDTDQIVNGGLIVKENGRATGVLIDNAMGLVASYIPELTDKDKRELLLQAQQNCFEVGLTTIVDAGLDHEHIMFMDKMQKDGELKMKLYPMLNPTESNFVHYEKNGTYQTDYMHVRSFKIYGDGALGSRGACLLHDYHDEPGNTGFLLSSKDTFESWAKRILKMNFQMNTHCIGDSANRTLLNIYAGLLKGENDRRWRIEHAQIVSAEDVAFFKEYNIAPSVQPTHATSDMYWAGDRLGEERLKTAYAYKDLMDAYGSLILGSDFPVEDINPFYGFYAAVARKDHDDFPDRGFQMENSISRKEALMGMTTWAAHGCFEEKSKGAIAIGKKADFVILDRDIMEVAIEEVIDTKVVNVFVNGEEVFNRYKP